MIEATVETFDELSREGEVLVDIWGPQCQPCLALMPTVESLAETYGDRVRFLKVNAPYNRKICRDLRVAGLALDVPVSGNTFQRRGFRFEVTVESDGEVTLTMVSSWAWRVSVHPTPQYGQMVSVTVWADSSQVPATRMSNSDVNIRAPVGHTPMQLPQYTHAESGRPTFHSVEIRASKPRPATAIAKVFCASTPQASTHL